MRGVNEMVDALNWMHGSRDAARPRSLPYPLEPECGADPARIGVLARLIDAQRDQDGAPVVPQTALGSVYGSLAV